MAAPFLRLARIVQRFAHREVTTKYPIIILDIKGVAREPKRFGEMFHDLHRGGWLRYWGAAHGGEKASEGLKGRRMIAAWRSPRKASMSKVLRVGYNKPLYILPFDHRSSFEKGLYGWSGALSIEQTERIARTKEVIYDGFRFALGAGLAKDRAGILVDEQFGSRIQRDAASNGFITAVPAEKSGQAEFQFEFGAQYAAHIEQFNPTFVKVLGRGFRRWRRHCRSI